MELIPGIPDEMALECLVRVHYKQLPTVVSVCKTWKSEVGLPEFRRLRTKASSTKKLLVFAQAQVEPKQNLTIVKNRANPVYRFTVLEPDTGEWSELPSTGEFGLGNGLPMFCRVASVGSDLVVLGGLNPLTWEVSKSVFVFNFVTATWRRGTDMPGPCRSLFGCGSDSDRMVYVVGGHDEEKNALRSAMAYDVAKDEWVQLPDVARERDECNLVFRRGKVHVIGGYCTEMQGRFERSAEVFDVATWKWEHVQEDFLSDPTCPRMCVGGDEVEDVYMCHGSDVLALRGSKWEVYSKLPAAVADVDYVTTWQKNLLVIGRPKFGDPHVACVLDLQNSKWAKLETPEEFSGHVQSGCCFEI